MTLWRILQNQLEIIRQNREIKRQNGTIIMNQTQILDFITNTLAPLVVQVDTNVKALIAKANPDLTPIQTSLSAVADSLNAIVTESNPQ